MRRLLTSVGVGLLLAACGSSTATGTRTQSTSTTTTSSAAASAAPAVAATNGLAVDLLRALGSPGENVVFSPYSIQAALAMVDAGAAGNTASQINRVLRTSGAPALDASNGALSAGLESSVARPNGAPAADAARLNIANGLWVQSGLSLKATFAAALSRNFGAAPQRTDFKSQPEAARKSINSWVSSHTAQLIKDLMPPGSITVQTALVLANAIYLKANWSSPFDAAATRPGTFLTAAGTRVRTPFMAQPATEFPYRRTAGYVAVDLPYLYSHLSMLMVMPSAGTLGRFQRQLSAAALTALAGATAPQRLILRMPRFHLIAHRSLNAALAALGMPVAFTDRADFSGITAQVPLKISTVEHGADLKVDEHGTIAAAATGISLSPTAVAPSPATRLTLDHPFLLFLRDDHTGAVLFAGRVTDPTKS